ncbi:MAG: helix-turn-helix domain-containing protein [Alicyclobacillus sp.]|nr:helix-turn-helix domain-containing protein [Alicyclobacillus sp.]
MALGSRIAQLRKAKGWTQSELARRAQLSASAVAMYETNRRTPDPAALDRIAQALGVSTAQLADAADEVERSAAAAVETNAAARPAKSTPNRASDKAPDAHRPTSGGTPDPVRRAAQDPERDDLTTFKLTREEAGIILFLRANPACLPFIESYVRADPRERDQLARAWRLIRDFQMYGGRADG